MLFILKLTVLKTQNRWHQHGQHWVLDKKNSNGPSLGDICFHWLWFVNFNWHVDVLSLFGSAEARARFVVDFLFSKLTFFIYLINNFWRDGSVVNFLKLCINLCSNGGIERSQVPPTFVGLEPLFWPYTNSIWPLPGLWRCLCATRFPVCHVLVCPEDCNASRGAQCSSHLVLVYDQSSSSVSFLHGGVDKLLTGS